MAARRQECSICMDIFKNPKLIPCHHSFCYKCLDDYVKVNLSNGRFNCPMCRKSVELPLGGVASFQENFYIDSSETFPCDICGPKGVACSRCLDCEDNLCQACCYVHEKLKTTRTHKVSDLGTLEPEMKGKIRQRIFCDQHVEEEIKLVCKDCKALICVLCKAIKHEIHATETVSDAASEVKKNIQIKMNQCSDKVRRITDSEREADALEKKIIDAESKEIKALEDQRLQLIKVIDQEVAQMKDKIQNIYKELRQQNQALKMGMKEELKKCSTATDNARQIIDQGTDIDIIKKGSDVEQLLCTAMAETVQKPITRMEKDLFSPAEIKVREIIPFIGMMRDSTEMSVEEREQKERVSKYNRRKERKKKK
ncbi:hypothetical protein ACJMK2_002671 [Sinanodonta woodiana]|uniref:Uncharacterized protein n=1 Tax=Sinanodonta woodiana TaxID=1069815 RepID=A0ABD3XY76_SINWO